MWICRCGYAVDMSLGYRLHGGVLDPCNQRGRVRYRQRGGVLDAAIKGGVRDICAGGCWTAAIKEGVRDICVCGCWTAAIKGGERDIVCAWVLDHCNPRGRARYRLRGSVLDPCNQRGRARYRLRDGESKGGLCDIVCAEGCWTTAIKGVQYRLRGGALDPRKSMGARTGSSARGGCWTPAIKGWGRDIVCAGGSEPLQSKRGCATSSVRGLLNPCNQKGRA